MIITLFDQRNKQAVDFARCLLSYVTCRYAYSEDTNDDFEDDGPLSGSGARGIGDTVTKLERKERKNIDHVFGLAVDREEDKRE